MKSGYSTEAAIAEEIKRENEFKNHLVWLKRKLLWEERLKLEAEVASLPRLQGIDLMFMALYPTRRKLTLVIEELRAMQSPQQQRNGRLTLQEAQRIFDETSLLKVLAALS